MRFGVIVNASLFGLEKGGSNWAGNPIQLIESLSVDCFVKLGLVVLSGLKYAACKAVKSWVFHFFPFTAIG